MNSKRFDVEWLYSWFICMYYILEKLYELLSAVRMTLDICTPAVGRKEASARFVDVVAPMWLVAEDKMSICQPSSFSDTLGVIKSILAHPLAALFQPPCVAWPPTIKDPIEVRQH